ncbi:MAG TPA: VWA domain-containing protein [Kofleriaceae bacterium]|nr:VWA domain-containing protein [Kofleriaceae bacterium]
MLIVLLNCSSSMDERFRGSTVLAPTARSSAAPRKIEAACQVLRECLGSLPPSETVVVLGFAGGVGELARGRAGDRLALESRIASMDRDGRADLGAAMASAARVLRSGSIHQPRRIILITDGLQEARPAERLDRIIDTLAWFATPIDICLIDPTRRGLTLARFIARAGIVTTAESADRLGAAVGALFAYYRNAHYDRDAGTGSSASGAAP